MIYTGILKRCRGPTPIGLKNTGSRHDDLISPNFFPKRQSPCRVLSFAMIKLESIAKNQMLLGIEPKGPVRVVTVESIGEHALTLYYNLHSWIIVTMNLH